jgi:hypothetical protein
MTMQITSIELKDGVPANITATLTVEEAAKIGELTGRTAGDRLAGEIYGCLTGELFNRFYPGGLAEYRSGADSD